VDGRRFVHGFGHGEGSGGQLPGHIGRRSEEHVRGRGNECFRGTIGRVLRRGGIGEHVVLVQCAHSMGHREGGHERHPRDPQDVCRPRQGRQHLRR